MLTSAFQQEGLFPIRRIAISLVALLACLCLSAPTASAGAQTRKKSIWGPTRVDGVSQFPIYRRLGVRIFQMQLNWANAAPTRPAQPRDPGDPAYQWPLEVDDAIQEGRKYGITVSLQLMWTPSWANGGRSGEWAPTQPRDFADFAAAAARRYADVRHWMIWGEPSRAPNFQPLTPETWGQPLNAAQKRAPRLYARMLEAAYWSLNSVRKSNIVIGGNTFSGGDIKTRSWIRAMRLPDGRRPHMDLYGHNPFTYRTPDLRQDPIEPGFTDFSDLDLLVRWLDRYLGRRGDGRRIPLFLSEFFIPTDHPNYEFSFYVTRKAQARMLRAGLRIVRGWPRIYTMGWFGLYDDPPNGPNGTHFNDVHRGLIDFRGRKKPAYFVFRDG